MSREPSDEAVRAVADVLMRHDQEHGGLIVDRDYTALARDALAAALPHVVTPARDHCNAALRQNRSASECGLAERILASLPDIQVGSPQ